MIPGTVGPVHTLDSLTADDRHHTRHMLHVTMRLGHRFELADASHSGGL